MAAIGNPGPIPAAVLRMRRHREEMQLALAENLTLDQARERLSSLQAHRSQLEGPPAATVTPPAGEPRLWYKELDLG